MTKLTINDIARLAGVSKSTVSRVLNNKPDVSPASKEAVLAIVKEYDFCPDAVAQSVALGSSKTIALCIPTDIGNILSNTYYAKMISAILEETNRLGYYLLFAHSNVEACRQLIRSSRVDGFIILSSNRARISLTETLDEYSMPYVLTSALENSSAPYVDIDNVQAGRLATRHLLVYGHRDIAFFYHPDFSSYKDRKEGFCKAVEKSDLPIRNTWLVELDEPNMESGYNAMRQLLTKRHRPTALFACNDFVAQGAMKACVDAGLSLPEDLSIIGFDNNDMDQFLSPPLTSVDQCVTQRGKRALSMLVDYIETGKKPQPVLLQSQLVCRSSVKIMIP